MLVNKKTNILSELFDNQLEKKRPKNKKKKKLHKVV